MRVLLQGRGGVGERRGGDSTLAVRIARELESRGHEVVVASGVPEHGLRGFDVVHAVNLDRSVLAETERLAGAARAAGVRLVVTPLWWPLDRFVAGLTRLEALAFRVKGTAVARSVRERRMGSLRSVKRRQAAVLSACQAVCPTGDVEAFALIDAFGPLPIAVVPLATGRVPVIQNGPRSGVLCVGRLDPRKNQMGLIVALRGTGIPVRLAGTESIFPAYAARCREVAGPEVEFCGFVSEDDLERAYLTTRVHALPSWFELPGLVSLDAAALGTAVVASRAGTPGEYFGSDALYCGTDPASIRQAVLEAHATGPRPGLAQRIAATFTWAATAERYLEAYHAA